jgi:hypothetical protein
VKEHLKHRQKRKKRKLNSRKLKKKKKKIQGIGQVGLALRLAERSRGYSRLPEPCGYPSTSPLNSSWNLFYIHLLF